MAAMGTMLYPLGRTPGITSCGMLGILLVLSSFASLEETSKPRRKADCLLGVPVWLAARNDG